MRPPVASLRDQAVAGQPRLRWVFRLGGFVIPLGVQDPFTRPLRAVFALLGLAVATAAAFVGIGLDATTATLLHPDTRPSDRRDAVAWPTDDRTPEDLLSLIGARPQQGGLSAAYTVRADTAKVATADVWFQAFAHGGAIDVDPVHVVAGRGMRADDEALVAYGLAEQAGWTIGGTASFRVGDHPIEVTIVGLYRDVYGGNALRYRIERLRAVDPGATGGVLQIIGNGTVSPNALRTEVQQLLGTQAQVIAARDPSWIAPALRSTLAVVAGLLLVVGIAQLAAAWTMTLREQRRDLAVLQALGATTRQLVTRSVIGASLVAATAALLGSLGGWTVLRIIIGRALDGQGLGPDVLHTPGPVATVLLVAGTVTLPLRTQT